MGRPLTTWAALASPRFLVSSWPWRSYAYLLSSVPIGVLTIAILIVYAAASAVLSLLVIGVLMWTAFPLLGVVLGSVERRRARLVLVEGISSPHATMPAALSVRQKLKFRRREQGSMRALGYGFVLGVFVWPLSIATAGLSTAILLTTLAAPIIADRDAMAMGPWTLDTAPEGFAFLLLFGPVFFAVSSYLLGVVAAAEASLAKAMLGPRQDELQRNVAELRRSRLDLVDAFETERARIERHLHDGVQQRLVGLTMTLGLAELDLAEGEGRRLVVKAHSEAEAALADLRAAVRGIHPRVLIDHGLEAAVLEVADRSPLPVVVQVSLPSRLPPPIEAAAYFVVSEALANVAKHAQANSCEVVGWVERDQLVISITDDGIGGAKNRRRDRTHRAGDQVGRVGRHTRRRQPTRWADPTADGVPVPTRRLSIVLAEDSLLLREGLASILDRAGHEVRDTVGDADTLLAVVRKEPPDVVITDVRMPPGHSDEGLRAAAAIRAELPSIGILVLSQYVADAYLSSLLDTTTGGIGYLLKDRVGHVTEFLESLDRVADGGMVVDPEVVRQLLARRRNDGPLAALTPRELEVLALMAEGRVNASIAEQLVVSEAAVRKHVGNIFAKLQLDDGLDRRVSAVLTYLRG